MRLSPEGFYEVSVEYAHTSALGEKFSLSTDQVVRALEEDNNHRRLNPKPKNNEMGMELEQEGPDITYGPDSEVDLGSDDDETL